MPVITVAREYGSGGLEIARQIAERLQIACLDREVIRLAADRAGVAERTVAELDERRPSFSKHMLELMGKYGAGTYSELGVVPSLYIPTPQMLQILDSDTYRDMLEEAIKAVASEHSAVIVGRAGQVILREHPTATHVRVVANPNDTVKRVMERERLERRDAEKRVKEMDSRRSDYLKGYYKAEWRDPHLYDLVVNSSRLGVEGCVDVVVHAVNGKGLFNKDRLVAAAEPGS